VAWERNLDKIIEKNRCGRPEFKAKNRIEAEKYLVEGLEKWIKQRKLSKFILCGHSLGGYIATKYANLNSDQIKALILMAPAGVWGKPQDFNRKAAHWPEAQGFFPGLVYEIIKWRWEPGKTPYDLFRTVGRPSIFALERYMGLYKNLHADERLVIRDYIYQLLVNEGTGDLCLPYIIGVVF